ncbi:hypothetical protein Droror1_Dr00013895 [Drosera rotundifolia]
MLIAIIRHCYDGKAIWHDDPDLEGYCFQLVQERKQPWSAVALLSVLSDDARTAIANSQRSHHPGVSPSKCTDIDQEGLRRRITLCRCVVVFAVGKGNAVTVWIFVYCCAVVIGLPAAGDRSAATVDQENRDAATHLIHIGAEALWQVWKSRRSCKPIPITPQSSPTTDL